MGKMKTSLVAGKIENTKSSMDKYAEKKAKKALENAKNEVSKQEEIITKIEDKQEEAIIETPKQTKKTSNEKIRSKKYMEAKNKVSSANIYKIEEAVETVKKLTFTKFDVTMELHLTVKKQGLSAQVTLPHSTGKQKRVIVANEKTLEELKNGKINFDVLLATPEIMPKLAAFARLLGPRGLMPNPKLGTVTNDVATAVKNAKMGQIQYRTDKQGIIHTTIGRASFSADNLHENLLFIIKALAQVKPASAKGQYFKGLAVSSTMGLGLKADCNPLLNASR
mgnify:CR=1 FL=1